MLNLPFSRWRLYPCALVALLGTSVSAAPVLDTPQKVWEGYDPREEALDIEILKEWTEDGASYKEMYFTGMTHDGEKVRVFAIYSAPKGGKNLPAVMHIHGGGQSANPRWLQFWNERGYAALTYDFSGTWQKSKKHTLWGKLRQGNMGGDHALTRATEPSVRVSSWYLWTRIGRRALTCLEKQPEVNPERLGIFGVSVGGSLVWSVAGSDHRIKAACSVYGVGWNSHPAEVDAPDPKADDPHEKLYRSAMEPEAYASLIKCPTLFLDGTNDHHGKMDWAFRTLDAMTAEHRQAFSPHWRHHIAAEQAKDLPLWMNAWLKDGPAFPKTPQAEVNLDADGIPRLTVKPDASQKIQHVDCYYAVANRNPVNRFWRSVESRQQGDDRVASLPVLDASQPLFAFANVYYASGVCLTSSFVSVTPATLGPAKATDAPSLVIDDFKNGAVDWYTKSPGTDPNNSAPSPVKLAMGPDGTCGVTVERFSPLLTHKLGDPKWRGHDGAKLQFQVFVRAGRKVNVQLFEKEFAKGSKTFVAPVVIKPGDGWQTVSLAAKDFKTNNGEALVNWRSVQLLELEHGRGTPPVPIYADFRWVK